MAIKDEVSSMPSSIVKTRTVSPFTGCCLPAYYQHCQKKLSETVSYDIAPKGICHLNSHLAFKLMKECEQKKWSSISQLRCFITLLFSSVSKTTSGFTTHDSCVRNLLIPYKIMEWYFYGMPLIKLNKNGKTISLRQCHVVKSWKSTLKVLHMAGSGMQFILDVIWRYFCERLRANEIWKDKTHK